MRKALELLILLTMSGAMVMPPSLAQQQKPAENLLPAPQEEPLQASSEIKAAIPNHPRQVLKSGKHFLVMDETGLMPGDSNIGCGLYRDDTRYLSEWDLSLNGESLTLLNASTEFGYGGRFVYGNKGPRQKPLDKLLPEQTILVQRDIVITDAVRERITLTNFGVQAADLSLVIKYGADFADMFEVRGQKRKQRGQYLNPDLNTEQQEVTLSYKGLDNQVMKTIIAFRHLKPDSLKANAATFKITLPAKQTANLEVGIATNFNEPTRPLMDAESVSEPNKQLSFAVQSKQAEGDYLAWRRNGALIRTDNPDFDRILERNFRDLYILRQPTPRGECLSAGIPWFTVAFGRDQDITGHETLPLLPDMTKEVIEILANYQGTKTDDYTEERPGRIMHELRLGEMARLKEIPFIPYYGTVDATPLWLCLLSQYVEWSGDLDLANKLWPNVESALAYLDAEISDGHYLTYGKKRGTLSNQGWKDSADSVMYANGELAKPPIALCEVQGYLYEAWSKTAHLANLLGHTATSKQLLSKASDLKKRFQTDFWMTDRRYMCIALDGEGKQCNVSSSNPGHTLHSGILTEAQNGLVADKINNPEMSSGWGVRTLSAFERAYNPLSYHDGSIWPHDNALIVEGLCAVGRKKEAGTISGGIFNVAVNQPDYRLPELFCGFSKNYSDRPIWYPVSCSPQAWAAGSLFLMLDSLLGLKADALNNQLVVDKPMLPPYLNKVTISNVRVGKSSVDLQFVRSGQETKCTVVKKTGPVTVSIQ